MPCSRDIFWYVYIHVLIDTVVMAQFGPRIRGILLCHTDR